MDTVTATDTTNAVADGTVATVATVSDSIGDGAAAVATATATAVTVAAVAVAATTTTLN